jgi:hypothetical protein
MHNKPWLLDQREALPHPRSGTITLTTAVSSQSGLHSRWCDYKWSSSIKDPYQEHQFKLSLHTPQNLKHLICLCFTPLNSHINLSPLTPSPQYFSPFGINLQKGSLHWKEEIMVDKWGQEVGKSLAYRISLLCFLPNKVCNTLSQDSWEVSIFSSYLT